MTLEGGLWSALNSDHVALGFFSIWGLKSFKDSISAASLSSLFQGLGILQVNFLFPYMQPEPPLFQLLITVSCSHTMQFSEEPGSVFSVTTLQVLAGCA